MGIKDFLTVVISVLALLISGVNFFRERKKSNNVLLRLLILTESIKNDFVSLTFNYDVIHLIEDAQDDIIQIPLKVKMESLESKVDTFYELLLLNQKISDNDVKKILKCLSVIEENLFELSTYQVEGPSDLNYIKPYNSRITDEIEIMESIIQQYEEL